MAWAYGLWVFRLASVGECFLGGGHGDGVGLEHTLSLGFKSFVYASDFLLIVNVLQQNENVSTYWERNMIRWIRQLMPKFSSV